MVWKIYRIPKHDVQFSMNTSCGSIAHNMLSWHDSEDTLKSNTVFHLLHFSRRPLTMRAGTYEEHVSIESHRHRNPPGAKRLFLAFVILFSALQTAFYNVEASSRYATYLIPAPRSSPIPLLGVYQRQSSYIAYWKNNLAFDT
jgi:hypothetical protein